MREKTVKPSPVLARFQFNTIGKPPSLLRRLATPESALPFSAPPRSSPFPPPETTAPLPLSNRPSLLESLINDRNTSFARSSDPTSHKNPSAAAPDIFNIPLSSNASTSNAAGSSTAHAPASSPSNIPISSFCLSLQNKTLIPSASPASGTAMQVDPPTVAHLPVDPSQSSSSPNTTAAPSMQASIIPTADLYRHIAELSDERIELQEARFARQRVFNEHKEYLRRHDETCSAAEREKEQMAKLVAAVQDLLDKIERVRERQEKRWADENLRLQRLVKAKEEEEEKRRNEAQILAQQEARAEAEAAAVKKAQDKAKDKADRARRETEEAEARQKAAMAERAKVAEAEAKARALAQAEAEAKERARVEQQRQQRLREEKETRDRLEAEAKAKAAEAQTRADNKAMRLAEEAKLPAEKARLELASSAPTADLDRRQPSESANKSPIDQTVPKHIQANGVNGVNKGNVDRQALQFKDKIAVAISHPTLTNKPPHVAASSNKDIPSTSRPNEPTQTISPTSTNLTGREAAVVQNATSLALPVLGSACISAQPPQFQGQAPTNATQQLSKHFASAKTASASPSEVSGPASTQRDQSTTSNASAPIQTPLHKESGAQSLQKKQEVKLPGAGPVAALSTAPSRAPIQPGKHIVASSPPSHTLKIPRSVQPPGSQTSSTNLPVPSGELPTQPQLATPGTVHIQTRNALAPSGASIPSSSAQKKESLISIKPEPVEASVPPARQNEPQAITPIKAAKLQILSPAAVPPSIPLPPSLPPKPLVPLPPPRPCKAAATSVAPILPSAQYNVRNGDRSGRSPVMNVNVDVGRAPAVSNLDQPAAAGPSSSHPARDTSAPNLRADKPSASHAQWRTDQDDDTWVTIPRDDLDRAHAYRSPTPERRYDHYSPSPERQYLRWHSNHPSSLAQVERSLSPPRKRMRDPHPEESLYKRARYDDQGRSSRSPQSRRTHDSRDRAYTPPTPIDRHWSPPQQHLPSWGSPVRALAPSELPAPTRSFARPPPRPRSPSRSPPRIPNGRRDSRSFSPQQPTVRLPVPPVTARKEPDWSTQVDETRKAPSGEQAAPPWATKPAATWRSDPVPIPVPQRRGPGRTDLLSRMSDSQHIVDPAASRSEYPRARRGNGRGRGRGGTNNALRGGRGGADRNGQFAMAKDLESRIT
ncbi:hypothetical protein BC835DRAFT_1414136 [Cytidiella melzeri]|nr:hypothetical protein BC835DRAFT_1414136 [Cytidiella melzeri]